MITTRAGEQLVDVHQLADQLGVAVQTIYRWRSEGIDMPRGFKVGNAVRWRQQVVDEWIAAQEAKAAQGAA